MKNELSWMPLATGSEAIRTFGGVRYDTDQTDASVKPNVDLKRERGNCASFISAVKLLPTIEAQTCPCSQRGRLQIAKSAIEDAAAMQYFEGHADRVLPV